MRAVIVRVIIRVVIQVIVQEIIRVSISIYQYLRVYFCIDELSTELSTIIFYWVLISNSTLRFILCTSVSANIVCISFYHFKYIRRLRQRAITSSKSHSWSTILYAVLYNTQNNSQRPKVCQKRGYTQRPKNTNSQRRNRQIRKRIQGKNGKKSKPVGCWIEQNSHKKKTKEKTTHWSH